VANMRLLVKVLISVSGDSFSDFQTFEIATVVRSHPSFHSNCVKLWDTFSNDWTKN